MESALFMSDLGYNCFNIEKGFEGDLDADGKRSNINGWKFDKNPWKQKQMIEGNKINIDKTDFIKINLFKTKLLILLLDPKGAY